MRATILARLPWRPVPRHKTPSQVYNTQPAQRMATPAPIPGNRVHPSTFSSSRSQQMATHLDEANAVHVANFGEKGKLVLAPPSKKLIVVTCMDARIDTSSAFGLQEGEAHVIRNAGGRVQDSLRSILVSQRLLSTNEIAVVQHTDCGMLTFTNPDLHSKLTQAHPEHQSQIEQIDFLPISSLEQGVRHDVEWLKNHPLVLKDTIVTGWVYDVKTGKVNQVV